jgi:protein-tyrosine phosphatase
MAIQRILVVCTGNICRSPMGEGLLREAIARDPNLRVRGIEVRSAGIHGWDAAPASALAVEVMRERGVEISGHRSQPMSEGLAAWADLILTMTAEQRGWILGAFPAADGKVMRLAEYSGAPDDIGDPYGGDPGEYAHCAEVLAALVPGVLAHLARTIHEETREFSGLN